MDTISIYDLSVTEKNLQRIAEECREKIEAAKAMACTEETKQAVKKTRTELKKKFEEYETERKARTAEYEKPLKDFKALYDKYIKIPFAEADAALGKKISDVETAQKSEKYDNVKAYAAELITAYGLNWLEADVIMPNVTLSKSQTALEKEVKAVVERIKKDVDYINRLDTKDEVFAEYMGNLDLTQTLDAIERRKQAILKAQQTSQTYTEQENIKHEVEETVTQLAPPVVEEETPEENISEMPVFQMTFTVTGTMQQLKALKAFLIENNIEFKNGGNTNE